MLVRSLHFVVLWASLLPGCTMSSSASPLTAEGDACSDGVSTATGVGQGRVSVRHIDGRWLNFETAHDFRTLEPVPIVRAGFTTESLYGEFDEVPVDGTIQWEEGWDLRAVGTVTFDGMPIPFDTGPQVVRGSCNPG